MNELILADLFTDIKLSRQYFSLYLYVLHFCNLMSQSSSHIKESKSSSARAIFSALVEQGDTLGVMNQTGEAFSLTGKVVEGNKIGRTLGYPTANLDIPEEGTPIPAQGIYAAMVRLDNNWHASMVNIGIRPTLNLHHVTIEAHLFDFRQDIYGQTITICFLVKIREEMRFSSLSGLKEQLHKDKEVVRKTIAGMGSQMRLTEKGLRWVKSS